MSSRNDVAFEGGRLRAPVDAAWIELAKITRF
jgi:hypothetical protein